MKRPLSEVIAAVLLAGVALAGSPALAQGLRGADDDPYLRVGRTAGEAERNPPARVRRPSALAGPETERPAARPGQRRGQPTQRTPRPDAERRLRGPLAGDAAADPAEATPLPAAPAAPRRPRQQNFRSLERPPNGAVPVPETGEPVYQGLPPLPATPRPRVAVTDPYAPLGLRMGTLTVLPSVDVLGGYDSNPERRSGAKKGSALARVEGGLLARSDWAVHELTADIRGGYSRYLRAPDASRPDGQGRVTLRLDHSRDTAFDFELRGRIDTETPGTANLTGAAQGRPLVTQYGGSAGVTQRFNRLALSARGSVDRSDYADASLGQGLTLSQKDRNYTQYGVRLRAGYEVTPGFVPFAEAIVDTRRYDQRADNAGYERASDGLQVRAGTSFEVTRTLTGEIAAGYGLRRFEDGRLRDLKGPVAEGTLAWAVSPLTTVRLRGTTEFEETTQVGSSGAITRRLSAELSHAFLRNLVFTAGASIARADFNGIERRDDGLRASLGAEWSLNRNFVLRASYAHERTTSNAPGNNVSANVWLFGARAQF